MTYWDKNEWYIQPTGFACKLWDFLQRYETLLLLPFPLPRPTSCSVKSHSFWNLLTASQISSELSLRSRTGNCGCCLHHLINSEPTSCWGYGAWGDTGTIVYYLVGNMSAFDERSSLFFLSPCYTSHWFQVYICIGYLHETQKLMAFLPLLSTHSFSIHILRANIYT